MPARSHVCNFIRNMWFLLTRGFALAFGFSAISAQAGANLPLADVDQALVNQLADYTQQKFPQSNIDDARTAWKRRLEESRDAHSPFLQKELNDRFVKEFFDVRMGPNAADPDGYISASRRLVNEERGGEAAAKVTGAAAKEFSVRSNKLYQARRKAYDDLDFDGRIAGEFLRQGALAERILFTNQLAAWSTRVKGFLGAMKALRQRPPLGLPRALAAKLEKLESQSVEMDREVNANIREIQSAIRLESAVAKRLGLVPLQYQPQFRDFDVEIIPAGIDVHFEFKIVNETIWPDCSGAVLN